LEESQEITQIPHHSVPAPFLRAFPMYRPTHKRLELDTLRIEGIYENIRVRKKGIDALPSLPSTERLKIRNSHPRISRQQRRRGLARAL
jgi:hypothetical protein